MSAETQKIKIGLRAIWRFVRSFKVQLAILVALGIISALANGSVPYITGRFFDALIAVSRQETASLGPLPLWGLLLLFWAVIQLIANNIDWIIDRLRRKLDTKVFFNIQTEGFAHFFKLPLSYHKNTHISGDLQKLSTAGWRVSGIIQTVIDIAPQFLRILIGVMLAASINFFLAGILLTGVLLYVLILVRVLLPVARVDFAAHRAMNEGWDDSAAAELQIESVKQAVAEEYESKRAEAAMLGKAFGLWYKLHLIWSNVGFFQRLIVFVTQLAVFIFSVRFVSDGSLTVGELVALNGYALMFFGPFVVLGHSWQNIQNGISAAADVENIFGASTEKYVPDDAGKPTTLTGEVKFEDVCFRYAPDQPPVLTDVSFGVFPGQIIALVGASGVGKSTAISLLSGYNFPTSGRVLLDGTDTRRLNLTNLRKQIAVVPQEVALFNDTIKANIRDGSFDVADEKITQAAREAHIDEFVNTLPEKYDTVVGERGVKLSVGQKQRIAIARAILRRPSILILDEPTSALDAKTEKIVTEALEKLMKGRTTFIIAHRLSTVRKANTILVFEKGRIVEQGTHQELIAKKNGVYRHLYEYQIGLH